MNKKKQFNLDTLAAFTNCRLVGNPDHIITGICDLELATSEDASFYSNPRYLRALTQSNAGVIFVNFQTELLNNRNYLISENPSRAFQQLVEAFHPSRKTPSGFIGIHSTAIIHETAQIAPGVCIGPYAVIDEGARIGAETFIGAGVYIGAESTVGEQCLIHPQVVVREGCEIGNRVIIQPGAVIGACGFGYTTDAKGKHAKLNQVGGVQIGEDVEIGANTTIDRARFKNTRIGEGTKIDNLVQIAHGVTTGSDNIIVAQSGIAGSTTLGNHVVLAGQAAIAGHLKVGSGVTIAARAGVTKSLNTRGIYGGLPAIPLADHNRNQVYLKSIQKYIHQLIHLIKRVEYLEKKI